MADVRRHAFTGARLNGRSAVTALVLSALSCAGRPVRVEPTASCAPGEPGRLTVSVVDHTDGVLPGATVILLDGADGVVETRDTDRDGLATFLRLPPTALCSLHTQLAGFESRVSRPFACAPQCRTAVTIRMRVDTSYGVMVM